MTTIQNTYINSLLAEASYVELIGGMSQSDIIEELDREALTLRQAQYIASNFEVIGAKETPDIFGSGFDAVVWRGRTGSEFEGQVFVSMRGTEPPGMDLLEADRDLASHAPGPGAKDTHPPLAPFVQRNTICHTPFTPWLPSPSRPPTAQPRLSARRSSVCRLTVGRCGRTSGSCARVKRLWRKARNHSLAKGASRVGCPAMAGLPC